MNPHLPLTPMPPLAGAAIAVGLSVPHTRTSGVENTSSWVSSENKPVIHVVIHHTDAVHDVEPSPWPSSVATSIMVRASLSYPPYLAGTLILKMPAPASASMVSSCSRRFSSDQVACLRSRGINSVARLTSSVLDGAWATSA